jgi:hypothetical protein
LIELGYQILDITWLNIFHVIALRIASHLIENITDKSKNKLQGWIGPA